MHFWSLSGDPSSSSWLRRTWTCRSSAGFHTLHQETVIASANTTGIERLSNDRSENGHERSRDPE